ncbi:hypothetical protein MU582_15190 [Nocardioidaceae bacterium SCSIO 66511]|nr:hypothetical protein MU582_15190 [Nocardioidaceae bacterium SCSIO 66511]
MTVSPIPRSRVRGLVRRRSWRAAALAAAAACVVAGPGAMADNGGDHPAPRADQSELPVATCPSSLPADATCYAGRQESGAYYWIAVPADWSGDLVMHAHGGPGLGEADPERSVDDLDRWSVMVDEGYAWAGSSYRRGGYGAQMAAADTEQLRRLFVSAFGEPETTLLHGQSWGGNVAAKLVEMSEQESSMPYDGALLTSGVLGGGSRGYDYRLDLRAVYQYYCGNHPRPNEPQYALWRGLPADSTMTSEDLEQRVQECTGYQSPASERTPEQRKAMSNILSVIRIPEETLYSHLKFATFTFRDIVHERLDDENPFGNLGVRYSGSDDDRALNRGVARYRADRSARRDLSFDSDLTGQVSIPILTLHAIDDPTAFVEHESAYRSTLEGAGTSKHLVQTFTTEDQHSTLSASEYAAAIGSLRDWVDEGKRPSPSSVATACADEDTTYGEGCFIDRDYRPAPYFDRVRPRPGNTKWPAMTWRQYLRWDRAGDIGIDY